MAGPFDAQRGQGAPQSDTPEAIQAQFLAAVQRERTQYRDIPDKRIPLVLAIGSVGWDMLVQGMDVPRIDVRVFPRNFSSLIGVSHNRLQAVIARMREEGVVFLRKEGETGFFTEEVQVQLTLAVTELATREAVVRGKGGNDNLSYLEIREAYSSLQRLVSAHPFARQLPTPEQRGRWKSVYKSSALRHRKP